MLSRRQLLTTTLSSPLALTAIRVACGAAALLSIETKAQGQQGGGNGGGNSGGNGNGGGNGNDNAGGNGTGSANGNSGRSSSSSSNSSTTGSGAFVGGPETSIGVRHRGGIEEELLNGRYVMRDGRGRTIINRSATSADRARLRSVVGR